ncbi:MAG: DUF5063 domain-containing protein [Planctomycetes bacterium]|nr:DUF5063 domain-containing protein [Planctomycetota bacterium]
MRPMLEGARVVGYAIVTKVRRAAELPLHERLHRVRERLLTLYWMLFDRYADEAPVAGELSDDLLDIYVDVSRGLALGRSPATRAAALWEWRFHFDMHWGAHAVQALNALHHACASG